MIGKKVFIARKEILENPNAYEIMIGVVTSVKKANTEDICFFGKIMYHKGAQFNSHSHLISTGSYEETVREFYQHQ
jgi:hypothetical protein